MLCWAAAAWRPAVGLATGSWLLCPLALSVLPNLPRCAPCRRNPWTGQRGLACVSVTWPACRPLPAFLRCRCCCGRPRASPPAATVPRRLPSSLTPACAGGPPRCAGELFSDGLDFPSPVSCSDAIMRDPSGRLLFHYAIVNLAAVPEARKGQRRLGRAAGSTSVAAAAECGRAGGRSAAAACSTAAPTVHAFSSATHTPPKPTPVHPLCRTPIRRRCLPTTWTRHSGSPSPSCAASRVGA